MKLRFCLTICLLCFSSCTRYLINDVETIKEFSRKDIKIGLVGFNAFNAGSFTTSTPDGSRRTKVTTTTTAFFDSEIQLKKELGFGEPMENFVQPGLNTDITQENLMQFIKLYLEHTKASGVEELSTFMEIPESRNKINQFKFKNNTFDYLILGNHKPIFREDDETKKSNSFLMVGAILSFFLIPIDRHDKRESTFYIFDKNLNLVDKKEFKDSVQVLFGFLVIPNKNTPNGNITYGYAFRPHIQEYHNYLVDYFNRN
jgi:hypothetical protein